MNTTSPPTLSPDARGNVHRTSEVVETIVGSDGNHRTVVHAELNHQGRINVVLTVEGADSLLDLERGLYGRFGAGNTAITASPMVFTRAP